MRCFFHRAICASAERIYMRYRAAVFDMDGTVLNTIGDLTDSLNYILEQTGHKHGYTEEDVRQFFGSGVQVAVTRVLAIESGIAGYQDLEQVGQPDDTISAQVDGREVERIQELFRPYYEAHCDIRTGEYPGISDLLKRLRAAGVKTAVVSNKPDPAVQTLAEDYFTGLFDLSIGEQPGIRRKPAPDMTLKALKDLGVTQKEAVYIGDSEIDMQTARNSGLDCISVAWGFRSRDFLERHHASLIVSDAGEIGDRILG